MASSDRSLATTRALVVAGLLLTLAAADPAPPARVFPRRTSAEAAVIEWGHSAIISALDGAVATFGPQTSMGASFEVETAPVLADPIDGVGRTSRAAGTSDLDLPPLRNADAVHGNLVIMTDAAGVSGVALARLAKMAGAAALVVVNTDEDGGDHIYSLAPETDDEAAYAAAHVDIPVVMVSLQSGNVFTTAMVTDDTDPDVVNAGGGLPARVRLYAGGDRPFFEDAVSQRPVVYLIHNLLTAEECAELVALAAGKYYPVAAATNYLENHMAAAADPTAASTQNVARATLWKGGLGGKILADIDERIHQVTGFPPEHLADFQVNKHEAGSRDDPHFDINPTNGIMATITVFLNDVVPDRGGEFVYSNPHNATLGPNVIRPMRGLAVVHHNTDEQYNFDKATLHHENVLRGGVKYVAKKYVYLNPQPRHLRVVLPLVAAPFGGKLPRWVVALHNVLVESCGFESAESYFRKIMTALPVFLLVCIASVVSMFVTGQLKEAGKSGEGKPKRKAKAKKSD